MGFAAATCLLITLLVCPFAAARRHCSHFRSNNISDFKNDLDQETELYDNGTKQRCSAHMNSCLAIFKVTWVESVVQHNGTTEVSHFGVKSHMLLFQGCSVHDIYSDQVCAHNGTCAPAKHIRSNVIQEAGVNMTDATYMCCCKEDFCNLDYDTTALIFPVPVEEKSESVEGVIISGRSSWGIFETLLCSLLLVLFVFASLVLWIQCKIRQRRRDMKCPEIQNRLLSSQNEPEAPAPPVCCEYGGMDFTTLQLLDVIGRGRYASVYRAKASSDQPDIAVKVYQWTNYHYFSNECDVHMSLRCAARQRQSGSECVVEYLGSCHRDVEDGQEPLSAAVSLPTLSGGLRREYWLATTLMNAGSLQDRLKTTSVSSLGDFLRIASSIADGLAYLHTEFKGPVDPKPAIAHRDVNSRNLLMKPDGGCCFCDFGFAMTLDRSRLSVDDATLNEVGTVRYMSPEVLEGAVNLRDPETALKQIDVYAMGLVLWEVLFRCDVLYPDLGHEAPAYQLPFQSEVPSATSDKMQLAVCRKKMRPLMPPIFKHCQSIPVLRVIRDLIEDCWDQDAEARISSECAKERLQEMKAPDLFDQFPFASVYPSTALIPYPSNKDSNNDQRELLQRINQDDNTESVNTDTTVAPTTAVDDVSRLPLSVSVSPLLQPHQERNPCQQRNMLCFQSLEASSDSSAASSDRSSERGLKLKPPLYGYNTYARPLTSPPMQNQSSPEETPPAIARQEQNYRSRRDGARAVVADRKIDIYDSEALVKHLTTTAGGRRGTSPNNTTGNDARRAPEKNEMANNDPVLTLLMEDVDRKKQKMSAITSVTPDEPLQKCQSDDTLCLEKVMTVIADGDDMMQLSSVVVVAAP